MDDGDDVLVAIGVLDAFHKTLNEFYIEALKDGEYAGIREHDVALTIVEMIRKVMLDKFSELK